MQAIELEALSRIRAYLHQLDSLPDSDELTRITIEQSLSKFPSHLLIIARDEVQLLIPLQEAIIKKLRSKVRLLNHLAKASDL